MRKIVRIGDFELYNYGQPFIIAEIGSNHNGDMDLAKKLILEAKEAGASCVKFQSWSKDTIFSKVVYEDNYFLKDDYRNRTDYTLEEIVDAFSLGIEEHRQMKAYCDEIGIMFSTTPFSEAEVDFIVDELDVDFVKIASMDLNNYPFLTYVANKQKPIILSTGLSTAEEIDKAVRTIEATGNKELVLLHCVAEYPTPDGSVNLNTMDMLRDVYDYPTGYSDHSLGITAPVLAVGKGACVIEKHFTLDKEMFGWDHKVSMNPSDMSLLVKECLRAREMLGSYRKIVTESEERRNAFRRSIVAAKDLEAGSVISESDLTYKRPGTGVSPGELKLFIGRKLKRAIRYDELLKYDDI